MTSRSPDGPDGADNAGPASDWDAHPADASPREIAEWMYAEDAATRELLGVEIEEVASGRSRIAMVVREDMLNSAKLCQGGVIFAFADSAVGFAANAHGPQSLTQTASVTWLSPARGGDRLTAEAAEVARAGRTGVFDVTVRDQEGRTVAVLRTQARQIQQPAKP